VPVNQKQLPSINLR